MVATWLWHWVDGDGQIPGAYRPASLAEAVGPQLRESLSVSKNKVQMTEEDTKDQPPVSIHI